MIPISNQKPPTRKPPRTSLVKWRLKNTRLKPINRIEKCQRYRCSNAKPPARTARHQYERREPVDHHRRHGVPARKRWRGCARDLEERRASASYQILQAPIHRLSAHECDPQGKYETRQPRDPKQTGHRHTHGHDGRIRTHSRQPHESREKWPNPIGAEEVVDADIRSAIHGHHNTPAASAIRHTMKSIARTGTFMAIRRSTPPSTRCQPW